MREGAKKRRDAIMEIEGSNGKEGSAFTRINVHLCCMQREVIGGGLDTLCSSDI